MVTAGASAGVSETQCHDTCMQTNFDILVDLRLVAFLPQTNLDPVMNNKVHVKVSPVINLSGRFVCKSEGYAGRAWCVYFPVCILGETDNWRECGRGKCAFRHLEVQNVLVHAMLHHQGVETLATGRVLAHQILQQQKIRPCKDF